MTFDLIKVMNQDPNEDFTAVRPCSAESKWELVGSLARVHAPSAVVVLSLADSGSVG